MFLKDSVLKTRMPPLPMFSCEISKFTQTTVQ